MPAGEDDLTFSDGEFRVYAAPNFDTPTDAYAVGDRWFFTWQATELPAVPPMTGHFLFECDKPEIVGLIEEIWQFFPEPTDDVPDGGWYKTIDNVATPFVPPFNTEWSQGYDIPGSTYGFALAGTIIDNGIGGTVSMSASYFWDSFSTAAIGNFTINGDIGPPSLTFSNARFVGPDLTSTVSTVAPGERWRLYFEYAVTQGVYTTERQLQLVGGGSFGTPDQVLAKPFDADDWTDFTGTEAAEEGFLVLPVLGSSTPYEFGTEAHSGISVYTGKIIFSGIATFAGDVTLTLSDVWNGLPLDTGDE